jgi:hypothetical protein
MCSNNKLNQQTPKNNLQNPTRSSTYFAISPKMMPPEAAFINSPVLANQFGNNDYRPQSTYVQNSLPFGWPANPVSQQTGYGMLSPTDQVPPPPSPKQYWGTENMGATPQIRSSAYNPTSPVPSQNGMWSYWGNANNNANYAMWPKDLSTVADSSMRRAETNILSEISAHEVDMTNGSSRGLSDYEMKHKSLPERSGGFVVLVTLKRLFSRKKIVAVTNQNRVAGDA